MAKTTEIKEKAFIEPTQDKKPQSISRQGSKNRKSYSFVDPKKKFKKKNQASPKENLQSSNRSSIQDSPLNPFNILDNFDSPKRISISNKNQDFDASEEQTPSLFSQMIIDSSIGSLSSQQLSFAASKPKHVQNEATKKQLENNFNSRSSKHLKGMDVSLNEADREFIIYKENKETYIALRDQLTMIEKDIKNLNSKLKSQEATYKYKIEEGELMNEDFISFKLKLLDLPKETFPKNFFTKLSSDSLKPEEILAQETIIEKALDGFISKLRQAKAIEKPSVSITEHNEILQNKIPLGATTEIAEGPSLKTNSPKKTLSRNNSHAIKAAPASIEVNKSTLNNDMYSAPYKDTILEPNLGSSSDKSTKLGDTEIRIQLFQQRQALLRSSRSRLERLLGA